MVWFLVSVSPATASSHDVASRRPAPQEGPLLPPWLPWLQLGLSSMMVVLFLVLLHGLQEQGRSLRQLDQRLQGLENNRALDRTTALEQQLRAAVERLRRLEEEQAQSRQELLDRRQLEQELQDLRRRAATPSLPRSTAPLPLQPLTPPQGAPAAGRPAATLPGF